MRVLLTAVLVLAGGSCATHKDVKPPVPTRYEFVESLPDYTEICVRLDPFRAELACLSLGEFRYTLRHMKRARLSWPAADDWDQAPRPASELVPLEPGQR